MRLVVVMSSEDGGARATTTTTTNGGDDVELSASRAHDGLPSSERGNDGLGAQESVSEVVGEVFSGYTCHSIEVRRARARSRRSRRTLFVASLSAGMTRRVLAISWK